MSDLTGYFKLLSIIIYLFLFSACASTKKLPVRRTTTDSGSQATQLRSISQSLIGIPYKYGGSSTIGFDCSGLTQFIYSEIGVSLPRSSSAQSQVGQKVSLTDLRTGDLIFFGEGEVDHVAMVMTRDGILLKVLHSTSSKGVILEDLSKTAYWTDRIIYATRVL